jgi:hypothetical protein
MSSIGTNGMKEVGMKLSSFGSMQINITAHSDNAEIMSVDIGAENRKEAMSMTTNKDETVDQFCTRVRSMLRALWNGEPRVADAKVNVAGVGKKELTWDEQKTALKKADVKAHA